MRRVMRRGPRVTRIYVSGRDTCYNGRRSKFTLISPVRKNLTEIVIDWNIPKHLARFVWTDHADGSTSVQVYPHDTITTTTGDESSPSPVPFFQPHSLPGASPRHFPYPPHGSTSSASTACSCSRRCRPARATRRNCRGRRRGTRFRGGRLVGGLLLGRLMFSSSR